MPMTEYSSNDGNAVADTTPAAAEPAIATGTAAKQSFAMLAHTLIAPSLTNPRKKFDEAKLAELAASIASSGVHQPILVRPLPEHRMADTFRDRKAGQPLPTHELVAGERRWRACKIAGLVEIPCLVKQLTDHQVLEVQIVENLQRDDLSELEEAEGYAALVEATGITKDQIGERIGRSRTYVYGRLKLLDLCSPAREALREGKLDASRALLIARIPGDKLQLKALKEFCGKDYAGDLKMGFRAAQAWIRQNVMLKLEDARFDTQSTKLVPDAGSCTDCPKRTGNDRDLFSDMDAPDLCTYTECYQGKQAAHVAVITAKARAKGVQVIEGKEALEIKPHGYGGTSIMRGYTDLDGLVPYTPGEDETRLRDALTKSELKDQVKLFIDPHSGNAIEVIPDALVDQVRARLRGAKQSGPVVESAEARQAREERKKHELAVQYEQRWRSPAVQAIERGLASGMVTGFEAPVLRAILITMIKSADVEGDIVAPLLQIPEEADYWDALDAAIAALPDTELGRVICKLLLRVEADVITDDYGARGDITPTPVIDCLATTCQVDLKAIKTEVQEDIRAELAEKAGPEPAGKKGRKGKKAAAATPEEALAGAVEGGAA